MDEGVEALNHLASAWLQSLPEHLAERGRVLRDGRLVGGRYVVYWTHHALRAHENPALDVAVSLANQLGVPVVVYQGLAGRHRFNSDRHHAFILEGARDLAAQYAERGIRFLLHVPRDPAAPSPLPALCGNAAALVVEDFPAPPFPRWTTKMAERVRVPVIAVDAQCIIPMRSHGQWFERAFKFESKTKNAFKQRLGRHWVDAEPCLPVGSEHRFGDAPGLFEQTGGMTATDPASMDIDAICAACRIDHAVPRVPHTPGGSAAGYARWARFKAAGLSGYAKRRNNAALLDGVSRMSAYLHYGMVSPFRLAREAAAAPGEGPAKFLNEMLVWRELAHAFCYYFADDPESLAALPDWARRTLAEHAQDEREALDWETLARGRTGDALWDAAQMSLLRQGELHNNLRMTWGKAIPLWSRDPKEALHRLFDLNHRYALDGNDPNSYGGLLWCLGQFDRPFEPEQPVLGRVRGRPTFEHASRIDLHRYRALAARPRARRLPEVAVIGAGVAGLTAARTLGDQGISVRVFDKGRGPGGRAATRFADEWRFDHGAPYVTATDERFARSLSAWRDRGVVAPWSPRLATIEHDGVSPATPRQPVDWMVGTDGMHGVCAHLARDLEVSFGARIERITRDGARWRLLGTDDTDMGVFDRLVINLPPLQAAALLQPVEPGLAECVAGVPFDPCWTLMMVAETSSDPGFDAARAKDPECAIAWIARECSKPNRRHLAGHSAWVVQASAAWSREHLEHESAAIIEALSHEMARLLGAPLPTPVLAMAHRWRYGLCGDPWDDDCHFDAETGIGLCGDWFRSCDCPGRIESAFLSGVALAGRILAGIGDDPESGVTSEVGLFDAATTERQA